MTNDGEQESPTPEDLAAEYFVRREDDGELELEPFLARLPGDAQRRRFAELIGGARRASRAIEGEPPETGKLFHARYEIVRTLGEGGMGRVYLARDRELGRTVALKVMNTLGSEASDRALLLLKESRLLAALRHPNIVAVHDSGLEGERAWLVMDYVDGRSLADVLERMREEVKQTASGRIAPRDGALWTRAIGKPAAPGRESLVDEKDWYSTCARIVCELARTIEAAHGQGVLHRDLKPANVMLVGGGHPVVLDFGLGGSDTGKVGDVTQGLFGSVPYLAPEQVRDSRVGLDPRTDVYQLGLVLYELLTLRRAFNGTNMAEVLEAVKQGAFDRPRKVNPSIPRELEAICMLALEHAPERRYATAALLREDLEAVVTGRRTPVALRSDRVRALARGARVFGRRHPVLAGLAATVAVAAATYAFFAGGPDLAVLQPFRYDKQEGTVVELKDGDVVRPGQLLGVQVRATQPLSLYAFSLFAPRPEEQRLYPVRVCRLEDVNRVSDDGPYGFEVQACAEPSGAACPRIVCTTVEPQNASEGLLVLATEGPRQELEDWMAELAREGALGVERSVALARFPATVTRGTAPKGGSAVTAPFTEAELVKLREGIARSLSDAESELEFPGLHRLVKAYAVAKE